MSSIENLSALSYKELRLLAAKNQIPGNIKKGVLIKIIEATKKGNSLEVTRLLSDMKKNKKKNVERSKVIKKSKKLSKKMAASNSLKLAEQKQNHCSTRDERYLHSNHWVETEQAKLGISQYQNYNSSYSGVDHQFMYYPHDYNRNCNNVDSTVFNETIDLRTGFAVSDINQSFYEVNHFESDLNGKKKSLLLKKMLQAPSGTNLGEIEVKEQFSDTSETVTAKSDIDETDETWQNRMPESIYHSFRDLETTSMYNNFSYNNTTLTHELSLERPDKQNFPSPDIYQQYDQRQLPYRLDAMSELNSQENCRNWVVSNNLCTYNSVDNSAVQVSSKIDETENSSFKDSSNTVDNIPSVGTDYMNLNKSTDFNLINNNNNLYYTPTSACFQSCCQSQQNETGWQNSNNFFSNSCQLQSQCQEINKNEYGNIPVPESSYQEQQWVRPQVSPVEKLQQSNFEFHQMLKDTQQRVQNQLKKNDPPTVSYRENDINHDAFKLGTYWPSWFYTNRDDTAAKTGGRWLENTLNLFTPNYVDYSKFDETISVFSNKRPVMTLRKDYSSACFKFSSYSPESRQHNFISNCLLFGKDTKLNKSIEMNYFNGKISEDHILGL